VRVASTNVTPGLLQAVLVFDEGEPLRTSEVPGLASVALDALPGLKGHRCRNDVGLGFAEEIEDTELAHLVEHAALEIMAMAGSPETLCGSTSWDFAADGPLTFRVALEWDNDLVVLGALSCASALVCALVNGEAAPDVKAEALRLRGLRRKPPSPTG
jgi:hypothetical protein